LPHTAAFGPSVMVRLVCERFLRKASAPRPQSLLAGRGFFAFPVLVFEKTEIAAAGREPSNNFVSPYEQGRFPSSVFRPMCLMYIPHFRPLYVSRMKHYAPCSLGRPVPLRRGISRALVSSLSFSDYMRLRSRSSPLSLISVLALRRADRFVNQSSFLMREHSRVPPLSISRRRQLPPSFPFSVNYFLFRIADSSPLA